MMYAIFYIHLYVYSTVHVIFVKGDYMRVYMGVDYELNYRALPLYNNVCIF